MKSRALALIIGVAALSSACAGPGPGLTGNDVGGIITWSTENQLAAQVIADQHCSRYDKHARITSIYAQYGGYIGFSCIFNRPYIQRRDDVILRSRG
jgi:hypothetical protein